MDRLLVDKSCGYVRSRKKWLFLLAAFSFSGYGAYRIYQSPSMADKRKRLAKFMGALISLAEAVTETADTVGVVSRDMREFLQSDSDQIPKSLKQISKITMSSEFSESMTSVTQAVTLGLLRGYQTRNKEEDNDDSGFTDRVIDKLFTESGSGFASVVVGSFAKNLVMAYYSYENYNRGPSPSDSELDATPKWVAVVCDDKCKKLIGDCVQLFVSTAVTVYLEKTVDINTYDEFFTSLTNPKYDTKLRDLLVSVCNRTVETFVKTSHQVLTTSNNTGRNSVSFPSLLSFRGLPTQKKASFLCLKRSNSDEDKGNGWMRKLSSTLAVPDNRNFVLDMTGRVTIETVRSFMEFLLDKVYAGMKKCADIINETVIVRGLDLIRCAAAESSVIVTICFSVWLHILGGVWDDWVPVY